MALLQFELALRDRFRAGMIIRPTLERGRRRLEQALVKLVFAGKSHAGNERLAAFVWKRLDEISAYLRTPTPWPSKPCGRQWSTARCGAATAPGSAPPRKRRCAACFAPCANAAIIPLAFIVAARHAPPRYACRNLGGKQVKGKQDDSVRQDAHFENWPSFGVGAHDGRRTAMQATFTLPPFEQVRGSPS
jgi:hypothetical protein